MSSIEELKHLQIPLQDILSATNDFAKENCIGSGGFGKVYKGESEKHGTIAIKRLEGAHHQGDHEFKTEIALLSIYKHENIVSLQGFCDEDGEKILVYKYESKGSLDRHLKSAYLTWTQRLQICLDAARGLKYLHDDVAPQHRILHRDVKSANILLDESWKAKISDFGLSREGPNNLQSSFVISNACGTLGYIDPEYFYTGHLTPKSDVFSFGVVLFEVLCGRPAFVTVDGQFFFVWVQKHYKRQTLHSIIHPSLHEQINPASILTFSAIAYQCLINGEGRPTMKKVVEQLQKALDNQLAPSGPGYDVYNDDDFAAHHQRQSGYSDTNRKQPIMRTSSSSQSSPATSQSRKYDVYLSFRGKDTRKTFVNFLYWALAQQLVIYKDDELLNRDDELLIRDESISASMFKAIKKSKIAIIIFSKNYADSRWCLDELAYIMKCRDEIGLLVIPVFYDVEPSQVRRQNQRYGTALSRHESNNIEKVESWRNALKNAADLSGFTPKSGEEAKCIQEIAYTVTYRLLSTNRLLRLMPSDEASAQTGLIGIETRMQDLRSHLEIGSGGVRMVGICGIWGSGKSTLASSIYDEISHEYEGCCFIKNVRAESRMHGLKALQEKILSEVFKSKVTLESIEQGISMMTRRLRRNRVLIVLDDVDHVDHLQMLAGSRDWFGNGSRVIFTTRNHDLVNAHNCITHNVRMLDVEEGIKLFSWHAFGAGRPAEGYEEVLRSIVCKFGGHPSALKSLGCFLRDKDMMEWMSVLARLEGIPVEEIWETFNTGDDGVSRNIFSWFSVGNFIYQIDVV